MKNKPLLIATLLLILFFNFACVFVTSSEPTDTGYDPREKAVVPLGEPAFPGKEFDRWVMDHVGVLSQETIDEADAILEEVRAAGYAEQAIVIIAGVTNTIDYTTQLARYYELGDIETDNGLLWVFYIDQDGSTDTNNVLRYTRGDGLNEATRIDIDDVREKVAPYTLSKDWNGAVIELANQSKAMLIDQVDNPQKPENGATPAESNSEDTLTPEEKALLGKIMFWVFVIWTAFCIGFGVVTGDPVTAFRLWIEIIRIVLDLILIIISKGRVTTRKGGGSGKFSGSSG